MGGDIRLDSVEGIGTTFSFSIDIEIGVSDREVPADLKDEDTRAPGDLAILLVEDNPVNQRVATAVLKKLGYSATIVGDGEMAVEAVFSHRYDLVLMDCQMPIMDGYEATRAIRQVPRFDHLPIIAMTASATVEEQKKCKEVGMSDFIAKPIDIESVRKVLAKW